MKTFLDMAALQAQVSREMPAEYEGSTQAYQDFNAVFINGNATSVQAQRVLTQLFMWCGFFQPEIPVDGENHVMPENLLVKAGTQQLCKQILQVLLVDPENLPKAEETYGD